MPMRIVLVEDNQSLRKGIAYRLSDDGHAVDMLDEGIAADQFLEEQLDPEMFLKEAANHGQRVTHRMQPGYDHSYYFVASFVEDHVAHHAAVLRG